MGQFSKEVPIKNSSNVKFDHGFNNKEFGKTVNINKVDNMVLIKAERSPIQNQLKATNIKFSYTPQNQPVATATVKNPFKA